MTTIITTETKNKMLDSMIVTRVSLHSASPGSTGREYEILSDNYIRQDCSFTSANNGNRILENDVSFQMKKDDLARFAGYWNGEIFLMAQQFMDVSFSTDGLFILKAGSTKVAI